MFGQSRSVQRCGLAVILLLSAVSLCGCETVAGNVALGAVGVTALGARTPAQEIEQIYYLGVLDPQEQVPPTVYRVRVHGQASVLSGMDFGSGWVPAQVIDSLSTRISFENNVPTIDSDSSEEFQALQTGRRLLQFGPEGFREAPKDHRLVIVMGASPDAFFDAVDASLGTIGKTLDAQQNASLVATLGDASAELRTQRERLTDLRADLTAELNASKGGK